MKWEEIRTHYPKQWLLIEAIQAHSEANQRILDDIAVINVFSNSKIAMHNYIRLHHNYPTREFLIVHTDRETLDITIRKWLGIRGDG
jgi:hypothetical protein